MTRPNFSGVWRLNTAKSRLPGISYTAIVMRIDHTDPEFVQAVKTTHPDGKFSVGRFAGTTSGQEFTNTVSGLPALSTAEWKGTELIIETHVRTGSARPLHFRDYWSLSTDGRELTMEHRDDDIAGQLSVLERVEDVA